MREIQETSETLDVRALAGVAIDASERAGSCYVPPKHLLSKPAAGNILQGETNGDGMASGDSETGGARGYVG